jgi:hypothetical protein
MNSNTIKPFLNLLLFALRNNAPGDPFESNKDTIRNLVEQSISLFRCGASAVSTENIENIAFKYHTDIIGPILQGSTKVRLTIELLPNQPPLEPRWQIIASFVPANNGQSNIFESFTDNQISGDGAIYHIVYHVAHRANVELVKNFLKIGQPVTLSTLSLYEYLQGPYGKPKYITHPDQYDTGVDLSGNPNDPRASLFTVDAGGRKQLADDLDELTVSNISTDANVTFTTKSGDSFILDAEETVSAVMQLQLR